MPIDFRIDVSIDDQQILPSIIVVVEKPIAETDERHGRPTQAGTGAHIVERSAPIVAEDHIGVVGEIRVHEVHVAVVLIVSCCDAHV